MRIIAGTYRSRLLKSAKGLALRPTSDYLREALFNVLGPSISGSHFLDIFAGTGAVGIEALSRGATHVTFIENHPATAALIRKNLEALKINSGATIVAADALRALESLEGKVAAGNPPNDYASLNPPYDYAFLDPPYAAATEYSRVMQHLAASRLLAAGAIVIVEHCKTFDIPETFAPLSRARVLRHGDAALSFYRR